MSDSTALLEKLLPVPELANITSYISFPPPRKAASYHCTVKEFGRVVSCIFPDTVRRWSDEILSEGVTHAEEEVIKKTHAFSKDPSSLFQLLVGCITCEAEHIGRLHLSGFCTGELEMLLGTGENDWIPASFTQ